ncbi:pancreatic triacylglycerol lipase-like [Argiope bruennichi]|uniref:pancreatic triacylglycerol lipase-like n=1 Tax=Argiope bruennichi TaxID=94029 RepID=UPI0024948421|nr:pancreatic triacylglycerol lipase-like [Argiope bruennichi]
MHGTHPVHCKRLVGEVVLQSQGPDSLNVGTLETSYNALFANKCIENLGCFYTGPPFWDPLYRPISLPPADKIRTRFLLYTRSNQDEPTLLNLTKEGVMDSNFDAGSPTKILIHGYNVKLLDGDVRFIMKDELLKEGPYNVIIVNWTDSNQFPYYQAFANGRVVGAQTAKLIELLMENQGLKPDSVHIIGHSLGGQVSGWTGERVSGVGRITGLDPAGPFFQNAPNEVRLDVTDADFVDVIHSNGGDNYIEGLGIKEAIGHMDFYPNGGSSQPGCFYHHNMTYEMTDAVDNYVTNSCAHSRANFYFVDSINRCTFMAVECESYASFEKGECDRNGTNVSVMGLGAQKIPDLEGSRKFYLKTDDESPFCEE